MDKILSLIEQNARLSNAQLACMLNRSEADVEKTLKDFEDTKVILGYKALIDWEKTDREVVSALIEVKVTPQRGQGFDRVAERIYQYPEVESLYLMSGGFDLMVMIDGKTMKEVALFVAEKLAVLESINSTATHFVLKKYKDKGVPFDNEDHSKERVFQL